MNRARGILAGVRFLGWRTLAAMGYDPYGQIKRVSLLRGFVEHYRHVGWGGKR